MDFANGPLLIEFFLDLPPIPVHEQNETDKLVKQRQKYPDQYFNKVLDGKEINCYVSPGNNHDTQLKFALTGSMIWFTLHWFHAMLGHPGSCQMCAMLQARYHLQHLCMYIEWFVCDKCQCNKQ